MAQLPVDGSRRVFTKGGEFSPLFPPRSTAAVYGAARYTPMAPAPIYAPIYKPTVLQQARASNSLAVFQEDARTDATGETEVVEVEVPSTWTFKPCICEFVGTFMLVFIVATLNTFHGNSKQWLPTAVGCTVLVLIYAVGLVSGGHLNPAVSLAFLATRRMSLTLCISYIVVQVVAGILGGLFFMIVFNMHPAAALPVHPFHFTQAAIMEFIFTTMLCFVFLSVTASSSKLPSFALTIGFVVIAAGYACGSVSGAVLNPAIVLGVDLPYGDIRIGLLYTLLEILGGMFASVLFMVLSTNGNGSLEDNLVLKAPSLTARLLSEFVGTSFVVLTFGLNVILFSGATGWAVGAALLCMVYASGSVSGGHFNPVVTAAFVMKGQCKLAKKDVLLYVVAQLVSGIFAGTLLSYMHHHGPTTKWTFDLAISHGDFHWGAIMAVEVLFTFFFVYVVLAMSSFEDYAGSVARGQRSLHFALAVGFSMGVAIFAAGPISGGYLNPATALSFAVEAMPSFKAHAAIHPAPGWGPQAVDYFLKFVSLTCQFLAYFGNWLLYVIFEGIGAALAVLVFECTHPHDNEKGSDPQIYAQYALKEGDA